MLSLKLTGGGHMKWALLGIFCGYSVFAEGIQDSSCAEITKKLNKKTGQMECPQTMTRVPDNRLPIDKLPRAAGTEGVPRVGGLLPIGVQGPSRKGNEDSLRRIKIEHEINMRAVRSILDRICKRYSNQKPITALGECPVLDEHKAAYKKEVLTYCKAIPNSKKLKSGAIQHGKISGSNITIEQGSCIIGNINFPDNITIPKETVIINLGEDVFDFKISQADLVSGIYTSEKQRDLRDTNLKPQPPLHKSSLEAGSTYPDTPPSRGRVSPPGAR